MAQPITASSEIARTDHEQERVRFRLSATILLLGGLVFLLGVSRPVVQTWAENWDDEAARIALAQAESGEFRFGFVTMGIGFVVMGLGTALMLRAMSNVLTERRASVARIAWIVALLGGLVLGLGRAITTMVDLDAAARGDGIDGVLGTIGLSLGIVACGLLTWRGPMPRWVGVAFALAGLSAAPTIPAVYMFAAICFGLFGIVYFRPGRSVSVN